jgi:hypothetical protein
MAWHFGGKVAKCDRREYGCAQLRMTNFDDTGAGSSLHALFEGMGEEVQVYDHVALLSRPFLNDFFRFGCPTVTNFPRNHLVFASSARQIQRHLQPSLTKSSRSTEFNFTQRSRAHLAGRKSSAVSWSTYAAVGRIGQWSRYPYCPVSACEDSEVELRRPSSSGRRLLGYETFVEPKVTLLEPSVVEWTAPSLQS